MWSDSEFFNGEVLFLIVVFLVGASQAGSRSVQLAMLLCFASVQSQQGLLCWSIAVVHPSKACSAGALQLCIPARLVLLEHCSCASHALQQLLVPVVLGKLHQGEGAASRELGTHLPAFWRGLYLIKTNEQMTAACVGRGTVLHDYTL